MDPPVHLAIRAGQIDELEAGLAAGWDVNERDRRGMTGLCLAAHEAKASYYYHYYDYYYYYYYYYDYYYYYYYE